MHFHRGQKQLAVDAGDGVLPFARTGSMKARKEQVRRKPYKTWWANCFLGHGFSRQDFFRAAPFPTPTGEKRVF
jgi:hypothetical protein